MTKTDQIKILNDKIKANNVQYNINRINAEISAFSEGDLDKYEFLTRKDLKYKPNALDKAKFEFSFLGKAFNQGLDKKAENYKEEGVIKLLKDIRDKMVRPIGGNNDNRNNGGNNGGNNGDNNGANNDDNDDNGNDRDDKDDRDNGNNGDNKDSEDDDDYGDEYLLKLDRLLKNLKDDKSKEELEAEELDRLLKNLKDNKKFLKTFNENIDDKSKEELEAEELDRMFKKIKDDKKFLKTFSENIYDKSKEELEAEELDRMFKKLISKKCLESFKEYIDPQSRVDALRKKLNNLPKTSSDKTSNDETSDETRDNNEDEGDDSEDNQIINFVDTVLKR